MQTGTRAPTGRRVIDLTEDELGAKVVGWVAMALAPAADTEPTDPDEALTRAKTGKLLNVSLSQVDLLSRRDTDPLPYYYVGDSRRYHRAEVIAWLKRQRRAA